MLLEQNPMLQFGIDLGGTKTEIIVLDAQGNTLLRERRDTPQQLGYHAIIENIVAMVNAAAAQFPQHDFTLGLGIPGAVSPATGLIKNANTTCLIGHNLSADLEAALNKKIIIANDADCFALSEASDGAGKDFASTFAVIIGTGCGGGFVFNGKLLQGPNAIAGEWGHNPLPWQESNDPALPCYCGKIGCIETYVSGPGLSKQAEQETGFLWRAQEWQLKAEQGDALAQQVLHNFYCRLAKALASIINVLDPHVIVLGGGLSNLPGIYTEVPKLWQQYAFSDVISTPLKQAVHGDSSGVRGAAWLGSSK